MSRSNDYKTLYKKNQFCLILTYYSMKSALCFFLVLISTHLSFSQRYLTDESCIDLIKTYAKKIVEDTKVTHSSTNNKFKEVSNFIVTERHINNAPKIIKFNFINEFKSSSMPDTDFGTICFYFDQGYPIAYYNDKSIFACSKFIHDYSFAVQNRTRQEYQLIDNTYKKFRLNNLKGNQSFQQVISKLNRYPVSTDPKNCLAIITKNEKQYVLKWFNKKAFYVDAFGNKLGSTDDIDFKVTGANVDIKYYKNISNHDIVIKGIRKKTYANRDFEYYENSMLLKPNDVTDYFEFTRGGWDDDSEYNVQYLFDAEIPKNLMAGEVSEPIIVLSQPSVTATPQPTTSAYSSSPSTNNAGTKNKSSYDVTAYLPKRFSGTMTNKTFNLTSNCQMTLYDNKGGTFQLVGSTDNVNLVGRWSLRGRAKEVSGAIHYEFKGDILLGYEGTNWPKGTTVPFTVVAEITNQGMKGRFTIMKNSKGVEEQEGEFNIY